jgi:HemY protein
MLRALWFIFLLAVLATSAMWLVDNPGQVSMAWQGYVIETSAAVLFSAIAGIAVLSALMHRFWIFISDLPAGVSRFRREGRRRRGYLALSRGMTGARPVGRQGGPMICSKNHH